MLRLVILTPLVQQPRIHIIHLAIDDRPGIVGLDPGAARSPQPAVEVGIGRDAESTQARI